VTVGHGYAIWRYGHFSLAAKLDLHSLTTAALPAVTIDQRLFILAMGVVNTFLPSKVDRAEIRMNRRRRKATLSGTSILSLSATTGAPERTAVDSQRRTSHSQIRMLHNLCMMLLSQSHIRSLYSQRTPSLSPPHSLPPAVETDLKDLISGKGTVVSTPVKIGSTINTMRHS
jgi:hypothetical protein